MDFNFFSPLKSTINIVYSNFIQRILYSCPLSWKLKGDSQGGKVTQSQILSRPNRKLKTSKQKHMVWEMYSYLSRRITITGSLRYTFPCFQKFSLFLEFSISFLPFFALLIKGAILWLCWQQPCLTLPSSTFDNCCLREFSLTTLSQRVQSSAAMLSDRC